MSVNYLNYIYIPSFFTSGLCVSQGMITIVLECINRLNVYNTAAHFSEFAGEEAAESWKEIVNLLYELLGAIIYQIIYMIHCLKLWRP